MNAKWSARSESLWMFLLLTSISVLIYLPWVGQIGYLNDDWYLMYSAHAYGPPVFTDIFSVDRPARALVMMPAYSLFGDNPVYYNLSAYAFRLIAAFAFLWLLRILWPRQQGATFLASLLFLIYPGFLSQLNGIDYQSQLVSLAAAMLSIVLTVKASLSTHTWQRIGLISISVLLGWLYLSLVEYFLGFEYLRLASLFLLSFRENAGWWNRFVGGIKRWLPNIFTPLLFLVWRLFFFASERGATDVSSQLGGALESPLITFFWWTVHLATDSLDVLFSAWIIPFSSMFPGLRFRYVIFGLFVAVLTIFLVYLLITRILKKVESNDFAAEWQNEMLFLGLTMVVVGLMPIVLVNREVSFPYYSRYSLASSSGAALALTAILFMMPLVRIRWGLFSLLIVLSVLTHHANANRALNETQALREFWWQVSWRVPQLEPETTLVANYSASSIVEDYFVWGPANLIYYPESIGEKDKITPALYATILNNDTRLKILYRVGQMRSYRKNIITYPDFSNILILTRPSVLSCVQLIDGNQPEVSATEDGNVILVAPYSDVDLVMLDSEVHIPSQVVFGSEPPHDWCYFYEKASLARQRGDWDEVRKIGDDAFKNDLVAQDEIEWLPFLQAYVIAGDIDRLIEIKKLMKKADPYVFMQTCEILSSMPSLPDLVVEMVDSLYCVRQ